MMTFFVLALLWSTNNLLFLFFCTLDVRKVAERLELMRPIQEYIQIPKQDHVEYCLNKENSHIVQTSNNQVDRVIQENRTNYNLDPYMNQDLNSISQSKCR